MEKVGKDAVMQADRDGRAGRGRGGETGGGKRWRQRIKVDRRGDGIEGTARERKAINKRRETDKRN